jgi:hypothetical protein
MPEITGFPKAEPSTFHLKVPKLGFFQIIVGHVLIGFDHF